MSDDALDYAVTHGWRLRCRACGATWRERSAEATACPECESWAIVTVRLEALEGLDDWPPWKQRTVP
jgi:hypothetical protein